MRLVVLLYADDTVIVAKSENDLQYTLLTGFIPAINNGSLKLMPVKLKS